MPPTQNARNSKLPKPKHPHHSLPKSAIVLTPPAAGRPPNFVPLPGCADDGRPFLLNGDFSADL